MNVLLSVAAPVFGLVFCGFLAARFRLLGEHSTEALNRFVYYFALPAMLFISVARAPLAEILNWPYLGAVTGGILVTYAVVALLSRLVWRDSLSVFAMRGNNAAFGNTGYMGIPLAITAFGEAGALPAILATVIGSMVILSGTIALIEADRRRGAGGAVAWGVTRNVLTSPLVLPVLAGGVAAALAVDLPAPLARFLELLSAAAGPCALFALGLFVAGQPLRGELREAAVLVLLKLAMQPAVTWLLVAYVFHLDAMWAAVAVLMAALPTGANAFVLGQRYGVFVARTSATILISTVLSVATVSAVLVLIGVE